MTLPNTLEYGDAVVLVQKLADGSVRRTNAIVLAPAAKGRFDLAYPTPGLPPKTRSLELIFRLAYNVPAWVEGAWIGFEHKADELKCVNCGESPMVVELSQQGLPSADDLDMDAEEKKSARATSTKEEEE